MAIDRTFRKKESRAASLASSPPSLPKARDAGWSIPSFPVRLLILNGFLLMYAFSVETVYAMFIKVSGRGEGRGGGEGEGRWKEKA